jgi:hypothetical protein
MLDVFYTVDTEVWCDGWTDLDARFQAAFERHIHGRTAQGDYGLPLQVQLLQDHGLQGVFFVEPLFATRFGQAPLAEIVDLLQQRKQDVQLHLHTEWLDEAPQRLLADSQRKRQFLRGFSAEEQRIVIGEGLRLLRAAGASSVRAFRAGNFGFNHETLGALAAHGLTFDSSYNACCLGPSSGLCPGELLVEPLLQDGIFEYPVTVFHDGLRRLRPLQITACSWPEMESLLWSALEARRQSVVIVSHSFELLDANRTRPDATAVNRFRALCRFLDRHRDSFRACSFGDLQPPAVHALQPAPLSTPFWPTAQRIAEQGLRRLGI